jgi:Superinfection immunity protein
MLATTASLLRMSHVTVQPADRSWTATKVIAVIVAILSGGYMLPWAIAAVRDVPHWGVFWFNLLLGWTIVGWIIALILALRAQRLTVVR